MTALALVSALALAVVYGLGGHLAVRGRLEPATVVTLALLLTRLYAPLTALAAGQVDAMTALMSFERVFGLLDLLPLITEKPDAVAIPDGPVSVEFDDVHFAYPSADKVSRASLEEVVATLDTRGGAEVLHGISFRDGVAAAGQHGRLHADHTAELIGWAVRRAGEPPSSFGTAARGGSSHGPRRRETRGSQHPRHTPARGGDGPVERHHRIRGHALKQRIQRGDVVPVGVFVTGRLDVDRGDGRLHLILAEAGRGAWPR